MAGESVAEDGGKKSLGRQVDAAGGDLCPDRIGG